MQKLSLISKLFIASIVTTGTVALVNSLVHWKASQPVELFALLAMTVIASRLKVKLPGINGTMSVNVPFLLIVAVRLNAGEALAIAALAGRHWCRRFSARQPLRIRSPPLHLLSG
jgi:hypothetical protein